MLSLKHKIFTCLSALYCISIVISNLLVHKIVGINFFNLYTFYVDVGTILYPITFLMTDIIAEFYGKNAAGYTVKLGIGLNIFMVLILYIASMLPATAWSPLNDGTFNTIFRAYGVVFAISLFTNYISQMTDITIYHKLKVITKDKHLWLRNNVSTMTSQTIDTTIFISLMTLAGIFPSDMYFTMLGSQILLKLIFALADTPFCYFIVFIIKRLQLMSKY